MTHRSDVHIGAQRSAAASEAHNGEGRGHPSVRSRRRGPDAPEIRRRMCAQRIREDPSFWPILAARSRARVTRQEIAEHGGRACSACGRV